MKRFIEPLAVMQAHADADRLLQGAWIVDEEKIDGQHRGCFFGCAAQSRVNPIETICEQWGMPLWLGYLSEKIFEGLPADEAKQWPVQLLTVLVDASESLDLDAVHAKSHIIRLTALRDKHPSVADWVTPVIQCWEQQLQGLTVDWSAESARSAESAAWSAAWSSARSAESAAWSAAWSAAESARSAAWSAAESARSAESAAWSSARSAESAAWSSAWSAAWSAHYQDERDTLLSLIKGQL